MLSRVITKNLGKHGEATIALGKVGVKLCSRSLLLLVLLGIMHGAGCPEFLGKTRDIGILKPSREKSCYVPTSAA